jgi:hypothetical protein
MGIIEYEQLKLRQQEIEVKALVALVESNATDPGTRGKALRTLCHICWPDDPRFHKLIEIEQETIKGEYE